MDIEKQLLHILENKARTSASDLAKMLDVDEETVLALIAECGRVGIGLSNGDTLNVGEFVESLDAIKNGDNGMAN